jgi:hypothetical protein
MSRGRAARKLVDRVADVLEGAEADGVITLDKEDNRAIVKELEAEDFSVPPPFGYSLFALEDAFIYAKDTPVEAVNDD